MNIENTNYDPDDLSQYILDYIKNTFNCNIENSFVRNTFENIISYGVNQKNYGVDQLAYFLSDMFDEIEFAEMKNVLNKYSYENKEEQVLEM